MSVQYGLFNLILGFWSVFIARNKYENIDSNIFLKINTRKRIRGAYFALIKEQSRLDVRKY